LLVAAVEDSHMVAEVVQADYALVLLLFRVHNQLQLVMAALLLMDHIHREIMVQTLFLDQ
tara:strand:+ start:132 stop:311 length:180 start_codon:yes stop_codon:yes gene_type:complete